MIGDSTAAYCVDRDREYETSWREIRGDVNALCEPQASVFFASESGDTLGIMSGQSKNVESWGYNTYDAVLIVGGRGALRARVESR